MDERATASVSEEPEWPETDEHSEGRLHRPGRALVALVELLFAVAAGWATTWAWSSVVTTVTLRATDDTELTSRIYSGPWVAATVGFGLLAALLLVDLVRQLLLAQRA